MKNKTIIDSSVSSLKYFNFEGMPNEKIIEKYEHVLSCREKQITDLSIEIGDINERLTNLSERCKNLEQENELLKNRLSKRDTLLAQELNNKEIMFMRLERKEQECDDMKKKLEQLTKKGGYTAPQVKEMMTSKVGKVGAPLNEMNINSPPSRQCVQVLSKTEPEEVITSTSASLVPEQITTVVVPQVAPVSEKGQGAIVPKSSARDKIRELKAKTGNVTKINLTSMGNENTVQAFEGSGSSSVSVSNTTIGTSENANVSATTGKNEPIAEEKTEIQGKFSNYNEI